MKVSNSMGELPGQRQLVDSEAPALPPGMNAYCSVRHKLLYVATPKVACTSLKWWFADLEGYGEALRNAQASGESDPDLIIHDTFHKIAPDVAGRSPEALVEPLTSDAYFRFALVRNPYKRIFSAWQSKLLLREWYQSGPYRNCTFYNLEIKDARDIATAFEGFLEHLAVSEAPDFLDVHWTPQVSLLRPNSIHYSKLVKIENAGELTEELSRRLGDEFRDPFAIRHANESLLPYRQEFITERSAHLIRTLYADDFKVFGYSTELPDDAGSLTKGELDLALKAISMIRGRHQRMAEMGPQIANMTSQVVEKDSRIGEMGAQIADMTSHIEWLSSQRDAWERLATEREQSITALRAQVEDQVASGAWLASQRDAWERLATEREQSITALQTQLHETAESLSSREILLNRIRSHWAMRFVNFLLGKSVF